MWQPVQGRVKGLPEPAGRGPPVPAPVPAGAGRYGCGRAPYGAVHLEADTDTTAWADDPRGPRHYRRSCEDRHRYRKPEQKVPPGDRS
ncbi:hypothetical protein GCM10010327_39150 [Streptomyces nitrosporeus]|nr:hypothetical protein GCM10010327_39150 [Streptomyces nitrosporeus]